MWIFGLLFMIPSLFAFRHSKDKRYLLVSGGSMLILVVISLFNMPLTAESGRRWQVERELRHSPWRDYYTTGEQIVHRIKASAIDTPEQGQTLFNELITHYEQREKLSYLPEDVAKADMLWHGMVGATVTPDEQKTEGNNLGRLKSSAAWLVDQPDLVLAAAIAEVSQEKVVDYGSWLGFTKAVIADPRRIEPWKGIAIQSILSIRGNDRAELLVKQALAALMVASQVSAAPSPLQARFDKMVLALPSWAQQTFFILQARAQMAIAQQNGRKVEEDVVRLAQQGLPLSVPPSNEYWITLPAGTNYGTVKVDYAKYGMLQSSVRKVPFPANHALIGKATVILSLDISTEGGATVVYVENSSGDGVLDRVAVNEARFWRFAPTDTPKRLLIPMIFSDGAEELDERVQREVLTLVRHDSVSVAAVNQMVVTFKNDARAEMSRRSVQMPRPGKQPAQLISRAHNRNGEGIGFWRESVKQLRETNKRNPGDRDTLLLLGTMEFLYYNAARDYPNQREAKVDDSTETWHQLLLSSRQHFIELMALAPEDYIAWYGWAMTWVEDDTEMMAGAVVIARQLLASVPDTLYERLNIVMFQNTKRLMYSVLSIDGKKRFDIVMARMEQRFPQIINAESNVFKDQGDDVRNQLASQVVPEIQPFPVRQPERTTVIRRDITFSNTESGQVDFAALGVKSNSRIAPKKPLNAGEGIVSLTLDINRAGVPTLVMIRRSSGTDSLDQAALDSAYLWRFDKSTAGKKIDVNVTFH